MRNLQRLQVVGSGERSPQRLELVEHVIVARYQLVLNGLSWLN